VIPEFEQRLADVIGARLPAPHTGRLLAAPGPAATNTVRAVLGVSRAELVEPDFLAHRDVRIAGSSAFRRVVRLRCTVDVHPLTNQGRAQQAPLLNAVLFELDAPDVRDGSALLGGDDPGFLIDLTRLDHLETPLIVDDETPPRLRLTAEGWFWPVGTPEEDGPEILEARVRAGLLPLELDPAAPRLDAGGDPVELTIRIRTAGTARLLGGDTPPEPAAFGALAVTLRDAGGRPGNGTLAGGTDGEEGVRIITVEDGEATVRYTPADSAGTEYLVVALDDGEGGMGAPLARFPLQVR
jgi:hypothetical protein